MYGILTRVIRDTSGGSALEFGLAASLIALVTMTAINNLGTDVVDVVAAVKDMAG